MPSSHDSMLEALARRPFVLLDGATGTELSMRGVDTDGPLWSAQALLDDPDEVCRVHADYLHAGADVVTANTFRTNRRSLERVGRPDLFPSLTADAVRIARYSRDAVNAAAYVAGCIGPVEDCYSPELVPPDAELLDEHGRLVEALVAAGVDLLLLETMNCLREARVAASRAAESGLPFAVSFTLRREDGLLPSGEDVCAAAEAVVEYAPFALIVNCTHQDVIGPAIEALVVRFARSRVWIGAQAHLDRVEPGSGWMHPGNCSVAQYADHCTRWLDAGARVLGGCCGTNPAYIAGVDALRKATP